MPRDENTKPSGVYLGRFQPFHNGHLNIVDKALAVTQPLLIVIGSANVEDQPRNFFSIAERMQFIKFAILECLCFATQSRYPNISALKDRTSIDDIEDAKTSYQQLLTALQQYADIHAEQPTWTSISSLCQQVEDVFDRLLGDVIQFTTLDDFGCYPKWSQAFKRTVETHLSSPITLCGFEKQSENYLQRTANHFGWRFANLGEQSNGISASALRTKLLSHKLFDFRTHFLSDRYDHLNAIDVAPGDQALVQYFPKLIVALLRAKAHNPGFSDRRSCAEQQCDELLPDIESPSSQLQL